MSVDYPVDLPRPQRGLTLVVHGASAASARERTQTRCRLVGQQSQTTEALTFVLRTDAIFAEWCQWYRYSLRDGALAANIQLPNGYGDAVQQVRFLQVYQANDLNNGWQVTATVELLNPPRMTADDVAGLIAYGSFDISADAAALHTLVHVTLPADIP